HFLRAQRRAQRDLQQRREKAAAVARAHLVRQLVRVEREGEAEVQAAQQVGEAATLAGVGAREQGAQQSLLASAVLDQYYGDHSSFYFFHRDQPAHTPTLISSLQLPGQPGQPADLTTPAGVKAACRASQRHYSAAEPTGVYAAKPVDTTARATLLGSLTSHLTPTQARAAEGPDGSPMLAARTARPRGLDGLPMVVYDRLWVELGRPLRAMLQEALADTADPAPLAEFLTGIITLVPKAGMPRDQVAGYRPITLLNCDVRVVARAVEDRLELPLDLLVSPPQSAFILGRDISDSVQFHLGLLEYLQQRGSPAWLLLLDLAGAYDNVSWGLLLDTMEAMGFCREGHVRWAQLLHRGATSQVLVNGHLTDSFPLASGLLQGSGASPLYWCNVLQPLVSYLSSLQLAGRISTPTIPYSPLAMHRAALTPALPSKEYADDLTIVVLDRVRDGKVVVEALGLFRAAGGPALSVSKSSALPCAQPEPGLGNQGGSGPEGAGREGRGGDGGEGGGQGQVGEQGLGGGLGENGGQGQQQGGQEQGGEQEPEVVIPAVRAGVPVRHLGVPLGAASYAATSESAFGGAAAAMMAASLPWRPQGLNLLVRVQVAQQCLASKSIYQMAFVQPSAPLAQAMALAVNRFVAASDLPQERSPNSSSLYPSKAICVMPRGEGGVGLPDLGVTSTAMLAKMMAQLWSPRARPWQPLTHSLLADPSHGLSTWVITDPTATPSRGISPRLQAHVAALAELKLFRAVPPAGQSFFSVLAEPLWYNAQVRMNPAAREAAAEQGWTHVRHVREALHSHQLEREARWAADLVRACLPEPWQGMVDRLQPPQPEWECLRVGPGVGFVMRRTPLLQPSHWVGPNGRLYPLDPTGQGPLGAFWAEGGAAWEPAAVARLNKPSYRLTPEERATHLRPLPAQHHVAQEQAQGQEQGGARAVGRGGGRAMGRGGGRGQGRGGGGGRRGAGGGAGGQAADPANEGPGTWPKEEWLLGPWAHLQLDPQVWGMGTTTLLDFSVKHARVRLHQLQRVSANPLYPPGGGLWPALWGVRPPRAACEPEMAAVADGALRELELKWEASAQRVADQGAAGEREQQGRDVEERIPEEVHGSQPPRWLDTSAKAHQRPSPQMRAAQKAERQLEAQQRRGGRQPVAQPAPRADTADQLAVDVHAGQPCAKVWKELLDPTLRREHVIVAWRVLHASLMVGALWGHILKGAAAPGSSACRFCSPWHLETLTHAFLICPAVVPAWEWVLDVYGRLTGTRPPSGDAILLLSGRPTRGEAPPFQPPDSLLWLRLRVAYLGAVWRLRSSGAATALHPQQVARRVVEEVISTLTTAVKRDWHRVGRDIRVGLCGAVPSTWFKGKDPELDAAHFDQLWPECWKACPPGAVDLEHRDSRACASGLAEESMATNPSLSGNQPTILDDDNWPIWSIRTEGLLIEAGLWSVVADGVTPLPTAPAANATQQEQAAYIAELTRSRAETALDRKAKAFIQRHVSNLHIFTVKNANSAQDSWETLESQFTQSSVARQSQLQQQLSLLRMEPGESVSRFYARLQQLLTELEACSCETSESTVVLAILAALPPEYEGTVERLRYDQTSADLTVERIKRVLLQKEADLLSKQMQQQLNTSSSTLWSYSSPSEHRGAGSSGGQGGRGRSRAPQQPREQLSRAQSPDRSTRDASSHAHLTCNYCAKPGHIMSECFTFDRDQRNRLKTLFSNPARTSSPGRRPSPSRSSSPARPSSPGRGRTQTPGRTAAQSPSRGASLFTATAADDDDEDDDDDALMQIMQPRLNFNSDLYSPFFIDSGASQHILKDLQFFYNYTPFAPDKHRPVKLAAAGHRVWAVGSGSVFLSTKRGSWFLSHALYVPDSKENFISVSAATEDGSSFLFCGDLCQISSNRFGSMLRVNANKIRNSYILAAVPMPDGPDTDSEPEKLYGIQQSNLQPDNRVKLELLTNTAAPSANSSTFNSPKVWHQRLCHASYAALSRMQSADMVSGVPVTASQFRAAASDPTVCVGCVKGKQHKNVAFADPPPNAAPVTAPLGLIHMDVCGPMHARARDGSLYVATFLDEHTKLSVCVPISSKSQVPDVVRTVIEQLETQSGFRCKAIRTDNGTEYVNSRMKEYCSSKGIVHQHSAPYSPQQNGAAERLNRTIFEKARSILHAANISLSFWAHAVKYANYIRCLLPVSGQPLTPWEAFYGVKPDLSGLRVFGCRVWLHVPDHKRSKLQSKSVEGLFIGYQPGSKAYLVEVNGRETCSKDIVFDELSVLQPARQHDQPVQPVFLLPLPPSPFSSSEPAAPAEGGNSLQQTSSSGSDDGGSSSSSSSSDSSNRPGSSAQQPQSRPLQRIEAQEDSSRPESPLREPEQISLTARYEPGSHMWQQQQLELISRLPRPGIGRFSLRPMPLARETVGAQPVAPATAPEAERPAASAAVPAAARPAAISAAAPAAVRPSASAAAPTAARPAAPVAVRPSASAAAPTTARPAAPAARPGAPGLAQPARRVPLIPASAAAGPAASAVHPSAPMPAAPEPRPTSPEAPAAPLARRNPPRERRLPLKLRQPNLYAMTVSDSPVNDTPTVAEALASPQADMWIEAMNAELASLHSNQTWSLEERPANARVLPTKWVLKVKRDAAGNVERDKARLVAKGYFQQSGVDVGDVYAPVSKHTTLRALLAKAAAENMEVHQLDFETAFLNGVLEEHEVIYVQQPEGFREGSSNTVCRLHKALYGLRQAPRAWHARLCEELLAMNFKSSEADPALFTLHLPSGTVYLLVYVDDCLLCTQQGDTTGLAYVKQKLSSVFKLKDLGEARCFLGMQIVRDRAEGTILISQQKLIHELVTTHSMSNAHSKTLPMAAAVKLVREGEALDTSVHHYSALVGSLLYLSCCTRPDIAFSVGALARHMSAPTKQHWAAACTVLCYLKGTSEQGLLFGGVTGLQGFTDADYAGDKDTARSTTGYLFTLNGGAISWSSRLQPTVAMSTAEAEYMAASSATKEALWLRKLMRDLRLEARCVQMSCDNQAALQLLHNPMATARAKHIDVHHHFVRERITRGEVAFSYCHTDSMLADIFTKPLAAVKFNAGKQGCGVFSP
ncbi:hypothetical protein QJQ45_023956, partial [Haematococcus lacustris]